MQQFLLIDDDNDFAKYLSEVVRLNQHSCFIINDSHEILSHALTRYDHIIVDLQMPNFDGLQVIEHLINVNFTGYISVISGQDPSVLSSVKEYCYLNHLKFHSALTKPCDLYTLEQLISSTQTVPISTMKPRPKTEAANIEAWLFQAIQNNELDVYFQPKFDLNSHKLIGFEALARWFKNNAYIAPDEFIPIAEKTGYINQLSRHIVSLSFKKFAQIRQLGPQLSLAINFSASELNQADLPDFIHRQAVQYNIPPKLVTAEITETVYMCKNPETLSTLARLRILGFKLSIDDFGTGYSSVNMLRDGPFTELKIDRSFISKITTDKQTLIIVKSIINMAKELKLTIVAEGIEDVRTMDMLNDMAQLTGQGYYFSKPLPVAEIIANFTEIKDTIKENQYV